MSRSVTLFKIIDVLCHPGQNYKKYKDITVEKDIPYGGDVRHKGDIYYSKKYQDEKYPVILHMHGGGFTAGDKKHRKSLSSYYADKGWFVYNINYRLGPVNVFPTPIQDAVSALNFLEELEGKYNLDLSRIIVTGDSAGAYLASYLVCLMTNDDLHVKLGIDNVKLPIAGLLSFCGPYDLPQCMKKPMPLGFTRDIGICLFGFKLTKNMDNYHEYKFINEASPINYVNERWCPSFLAMAGKDIFCAGQGEALADKIKSFNVPVFTFSSTKFSDNHCFHLEFYRKQSKLCFKEVEKFLELIKGKNETSSEKE